MLRLAAGNVATPFTAVTGPPPESVLPPGLAPIASVTLPANPVTTFSFASSAVTVTAGLNAAPATTFPGCCEKARVEAAAGVIVKAFEVAPASDPAAAVRV